MTRGRMTKEAMPEDPASSAEGLPSNAATRGAQVPPVMPRAGELFAGRYVIERMLGRGGMGEVYAAVQKALGRRVAVKILKPPESIEDDPMFESRFLREAEAAARLTHPNTITVFDFGQTDDGVLYIVMEYLEGNDVRTVLRHEGQMAPLRAIHVAKQVCKSLREAHRKGIVHRDLKPANVLLVSQDDDPDFAKVLDFGLVKFRGDATEITLAGKFLGSPRYTSPEALDRNREVDHRADIYAVGILLYAMVTGEPPFDGDPMQVLNAHLHEIPQPMYRASPSAKTTPEFEDVVARCLQKEPDRRFQSMSELLTALRTVGTFYGGQDTETIDMDTEDSLDLDDSMAPDLATPAIGAGSMARDLQPLSPPPPVAPKSVEAVAEEAPEVARPPSRAAPSPRRSMWVVLGPLLIVVAGIVVAVLQMRAPPEEVVLPASIELSVPPIELATPAGALTPPDPVLVPESTPEAVPTPAAQKPPVRPAGVTPRPRPRAEPTPAPEEPAAKDDTKVPGYKDNPYGD